MSSVPWRRGRRRARGFTLIELTYAAALFEIGLIGLVAFQIAAANGVARARELAVATNLASSTIEDARAVTPGAVLGQAQPQVGYATRQGVRVAAPDFYTVTARASQPPGVLSYYDLAVTVAWKHVPREGITHQVAMETYIATE